MPNLKTAIIIILAVFVISIGVFFIPFDDILARLPYISEFYNNTTITITSRNAKSEVFLDSKSYGETPVTISDLKPGRYTFKLTRITDVSGAYEDRYIDIDLERNTEAVIDLEIGPNNLSSGYILYYTKSPVSNGKGYLSVNTDPADATVYIDGEYADKAPINAYMANPKSYSVKVSKTGYENVEFPVIVREGYNLNVKVNLFPIPINIEEQSNGE
ncbi:MAG TPA: PEGA domain-containing protein [Candidatus Dojkabacteria bacterium]|nr:PEGA domain-containing protein [Candidatus Dojkabacteria bacterium]